MNFLRNVALRNAQTKYVFLLDVDFEPMPELDVRLLEYIKLGYLTRNQVGAPNSTRQIAFSKRHAANSMRKIACGTLFRSAPGLPRRCSLGSENRGSINEGFRCKTRYQPKSKNRVSAGIVLPRGG